MTAVNEKLYFEDIPVNESQEGGSYS